MSDIVVSQINEIENRIFTLRGVQVMLDSDLAEMYLTETKYINRAMKRNPDRFPETFAFQLTAEELETIKTLKFQNDSSRFQIGTLNNKRGQNVKYLPFAFTEQGVAMLSAVLHTPIAIKVSVQIINVFVAMRKLISTNLGLIQRIDGLEQKQLEMKLETDHKFDRIFKALENKDVIPTQGIFFNGQIFDAYVFVNDIIKSAKKSIILIDNYIDESVLKMFSEKPVNVKFVILTKEIKPKLSLAIEKFNEQYKNIEAKKFDICHDRFLIIDSKEIYHLGASLKDLGRKIFAFSKMESDGFALLEKIRDL